MSRAYFSTLLGISRHPRQEVFTVVAVSRASRRSAKEQYSLAGTLRHEPLPSVTVTLSADAARRQRGGGGSTAPWGLAGAERPARCPDNLAAVSGTTPSIVMHQIRKTPWNTVRNIPSLVKKLKLGPAQGEYP